ncbi:hypothetical protein [uncultured Fibrella sp.]|uniref:hypothetical protein n=1 Tax=uncultured Fibrella sp. TaxID=1284596 RepID=UPI0035CB6662
MNNRYATGTLALPALIALTILASGCHDNLTSVDLTSSINKDAVPSEGLVVGSVNRPVPVNVTLPDLPAIKPDLTGLEPINRTHELNYVAIGGSLSAGLRNGGLYREGQLGAFPNLLARQLGLANFTTPLFDLDQGNGTGYYVLKSNAPYPQWQEVTNNKGVVRTDPFTLRPYTGNPVRNLSLPYLSPGELYRNTFNVYEQKAIPTENMKPYADVLLKYPGYLQRIQPVGQAGTASVWDLLIAQEADFCTVEVGLDLFLGSAKQPGNLSISLADGLATEQITNLLNYLKNKGARAVVFTVPQLLDWPYFHLYDPKKKAGIYVRDGNNTSEAFYASSETILIPTDRIDATFRNKFAGIGQNKQDAVPDEQVITDKESTALRLSIASYNNHLIKPLAVERGFAVVDLETVYAKIMSGQYVTDDGYNVDPAFPTGNFFSMDGLLPSAVGQAVLANEVIKAINSHYKTHISLINITLYSQQLKP